MTLTHSSSGGNNFAYGGARTDHNRLDSDAPIPPIPTDPHYPSPPEAFPWLLRGEQKAFEDRNIHDPNGLYIVWSGLNDIADLIRPFLLGQNVSAQLQNVVNGIESVINDFIAAGAQDILVPNIPDFGEVPLVPSFARVGRQRLPCFITTITSPLCLIHLQV